MQKNREFRFWTHLANTVASVVFGGAFAFQLHILADAAQTSATLREEPALQKKINFISAAGTKRTPNPAGWEAYDGSVYTQAKGYGWVSKPSGFYTSDEGQDTTIQLPNGVTTSARELGRPELASWHGAHQENQPLVFRIDLPNGWYRVRCASVADKPLPVIDQRNFKCRANDSIFAGPQSGPPLKVGGRDLVEGSNVVEVTDGHLRVVVGDPAYGGWAWSYKGPWYRGWGGWWGKWGDYRYAQNWYQTVARIIDPGFHMLRLNSLQIERVPAPAKRPALFFRDFFNRDDSPDINSGVAHSDRWIKVNLHPAISGHIVSELYKTSLKLAGSNKGKSLLGVVQKKTSPETGTIHYATRVSLFTGEGSKIHSGLQEAGLLILGEPDGLTEFNSTFIGVAFDQNRPGTPGWVKYRIGNGRNGYRTNAEIPDTSLPFLVREGEYEIVVHHNTKDNVLERIQINGHDLSKAFRVGDRQQRLSNGLFGIRALMDPLDTGVTLRQFYWYYRVEDTRRLDFHRQAD